MLVSGWYFRFSRLVVSIWVELVRLVISRVSRDRLCRWCGIMVGRGIESGSW